MRPSRLVAVFSSIKDPRVERTRRHKLVDILTIALLTLLNGGSGWSDMELFAKGRLAWLRTFLDLPNGAPSEDTFCRVFEAINSKVFNECVVEIIKELVANLAGGRALLSMERHFAGPLTAPEEGALSTS